MGFSVMQANSQLTVMVMDSPSPGLKKAVTEVLFVLRLDAFGKVFPGIARVSSKFSRGFFPMVEVSIPTLPLIKWGQFAAAKLPTSYPSSSLRLLGEFALPVDGVGVVC